MSGGESGIEALRLASIRLTSRVDVLTAEISELNRLLIEFIGRGV